ncbi:MAG: dTDP-4-dehydrorhamnose reductase [Chloroflexi bacterium]|nr:dTDP-4-dehydrorhamnose reductase [Chloroflexota bacterium]
MRISLTGHEGRLGTALQAQLSGHTLQLLAGDIRDAGHMLAQISDFCPDVVIHAAALTNVDHCARNPQEAVTVNGVGTQNIAEAARQAGAMLVAVSTNEVFAGRATQPYQEYDARDPVNPYGYSKYVGEQVVERFAADYMIVRTAWLYGPPGRNFVQAIIERAQGGQPLRVVTDEIGSPTYAADLAQAIAQLIEVGRPGVYHLTNEGACSRYDFARAIVETIGLKELHIEPITSDQWERASTPPPYSPLANVFGAALGVTLRPWREALADYISTLEGG